MEEGFYKAWVDTAKVAEATKATGAPVESPDSLAWWTDANLKEDSKLRVKDREVTKRARKAGIPAKLRGEVWFKVSKGHDLLKKNPKLFKDAYRMRFGAPPSEEDFKKEIVKEDVPTFGCTFNLTRFCLKPEGMNRAYKILACLAQEHSEALYCPFLPVVVVACLHWLNEDQTFATAMALLHEPSPFIESRIDSWLMLEAFSDLAKAQVPLSFKKLCEELGASYPPELDSGHPLAGAVMRWVADGFPFWLFMRFMDNFVIDGFKTFYRFGLACVQRWGILHSIYEERISPDPGSNPGSRPGSPSRTLFNAMRKPSPIKLPIADTRHLQPPGSPSLSISGAGAASLNKYKAGKEHTSMFGKAASAGGAFKPVVHLVKKQTDDLPLIEARTVMDAVMSIDCPDAFVEAAYSFSFSRSQLFRSFNKGYARAKAAMAITGRPLGVCESAADGRSRKGTYSSLPLLAVPNVKKESKILSQSHWRSLWIDIPIRYHLKDIACIFTTEEHGYLLPRFYERCDQEAPTLLVVRTTAGRVFGAFLTYNWAHRNVVMKGYFGTGETFVFSINPTYKSYKWVGMEKDIPDPPSYFMTADESRIAIGGGGDGHAIEIDRELRHGSSYKSTTFNNEALAGPSALFECAVVEVWAFITHH